MKELIYIFLGGGTGSVLRYYVQELLHERIILIPFLGQHLQSISSAVFSSGCFMPFPPVLISRPKCVCY